MKIFLIVLGVLIFLFIGAQLFFYRSSANVERLQYIVLSEYEGFEIRKYQASLFTMVKLDTNAYRIASREGFSVLGGYIFGKNNTQERIAMTSPVAMSLEKEMNMSFLVPKGFTKENLPKPTHLDIKFVEVLERKTAAITFGGWASDERIKKYKGLLIDLLEKHEIKYCDNFSVLGYNPPYELFFRKNEVIVELQ